MTATLCMRVWQGEDRWVCVQDLSHTVRVRERCGTPDAEAQSLRKAVDFLREQMASHGLSNLGPLTDAVPDPPQPSHHSQGLGPTQQTSVSPRQGAADDVDAQLHWVDMSSPMYQGSRIRRTGSMRGDLSRTMVGQGGLLGMDAALDECVASHGSELGLTERQRATVARARGPAKIRKLAGVLQVGLSSSFMLTLTT